MDKSERELLEELEAAAGEEFTESLDWEAESLDVAKLEGPCAELDALYTEGLVEEGFEFEAFEDELADIDWGAASPELSEIEAQVLDEEELLTAATDFGGGEVITIEELLTFLEGHPGLKLTLTY